MKNILLLMFVLSLSLQAQTIYVNQKNQAKEVDGKNWKSAYKNLNKALKTAKNGDDVWVAKGEYILKATRLKGINIYGGFSGDETQLSQREVVNNETKLYGRLAMQNSLLSSVTILEEPEQHRVVEINFNEQRQKSSFNPNKRRIQDARDKRDRQEQRYRREHPEKVVQTQTYPQEDTNKRVDKGKNTRASQIPKDKNRPPRPEEVMQKFDSNSDGKISKNEAPEPMIRDWARLDENGDGFVEEKEMKPPHQNGKQHRPPQGNRR